MKKLKGRFERLIEEYGKVAITTYLVLWVGTMAFFYVAITLGFEIEGMAAGAGGLGAAWLAAKVTQPLRIGATLLLTPLVARVWHRFRPTTPRVVAADEGKPLAEAAPTATPPASGDDDPAADPQSRGSGRS